jgi:hypothetical protein
MAAKRESRTTLSVRIRADVAQQVRQFVRDNAGKPLYLSMAIFIEAAVEAHMETLTRGLEGKDRGRRQLPISNSRT